MLEGHKGSISTTHWCKVQMCQHKEFETKYVIQFHQQNCTQLFQYTQLEVTSNFYALYYTRCAREITVNLLGKSCSYNDGAIDTWGFLTRIT